MVANIIVAVICNLVALGILVNSIFTAKASGIKVTIVRFFLLAGCLVGAYFITPFLADKLYAVNGVEALLVDNGISTITINSCIFMLFYMLVNGFASIVCSIIRHALIKKLQNKRLNKAKMKRARSINPQAEKQIERAEWKALRAKYDERRRWYHSLISCIFGLILGAVTGIVVLMPYGYIAKDIDAKSDKAYLVDGFEYTLNGVIPESVFEWGLSIKEEDAAPEIEEPATDSSTETEVPEESAPVEDANNG